MMNRKSPFTVTEFVRVPPATSPRCYPFDNRKAARQVPIPFCPSGDAVPPLRTSHAFCSSSNQVRLSSALRRTTPITSPTHFFLSNSPTSLVGAGRSLLLVIVMRTPSSGFPLFWCVSGFAPWQPPLPLSGRIFFLYHNSSVQDMR